MINATERGDLAISRVVDVTNRLARAKERGINPQNVVDRVVAEEKEYCKASILFAIKLHGLIEYDVESDIESGEVKVSARLSGCVPADKLEVTRKTLK